MIYHQFVPAMPVLLIRQGTSISIQYISSSRQIFINPFYTYNKYVTHTYKHLFGRSSMFRRRYWPTFAPISLIFNWVIFWNHRLLFELVVNRLDLMWKEELALKGAEKASLAAVSWRFCRTRIFASWIILTCSLICGFGSVRYIFF